MTDHEKLVADIKAQIQLMKDAHKAYLVKEETVKEVEIVKELADSGKSVRVIAAMLGVSKSRVQQLLEEERGTSPAE